MGVFKDAIQRISIKDEPHRLTGKIPLLYGTGGHTAESEDKFREMWMKHAHETGFAVLGIDPYKEEYMKITQFDRNFNRLTYPNTEFLKEVFPKQNEKDRHVEYHSEDFELELKKFFAFGRRRTGRTKMLARVLVETAIESGREIELVDHYIDRRGMREAVHHMRRQVMDVIHEYRHKEVYIEICKETKDTIQLFLDPRYFDNYMKIRIENNPTKFEVFPREELKKRLVEVRRNMLLISRRRKL